MKTDRDPRPEPARVQVPLTTDRRHAASIEALARELALPVDAVTPLYEAVLREMMADARVTDFLAVLTAKKVKERYRNTVLWRGEQSPAGGWHTSGCTAGSPEPATRLAPPAEGTTCLQQST